MSAPGKTTPDNEQLPMSYLHSAYVDQEYLVMGSHLDENTLKKIVNHEFVDFNKLLHVTAAGLRMRELREWS